MIRQRVRSWTISRTRTEASAGPAPAEINRAAARLTAAGGRVYLLAARVRDTIVAGLALAFCSPLIVVLVLLSRWSTGASGLFRQVRVGKDGRNFVVVKIRSLAPSAPSTVSKKQAEHLATPVGTFMRKWKLDELPQFLNVLKGEMTLVGPRPIIPEEYAADEQRVRLAVHPGLTGLWQLSRVREEPFHKNPEYDLFYLANRSFSFDLWIIWRTLLLLAFGKETKIRLAARLWERNPAWRDLTPQRSMTIPGLGGLHRSRLWVAGTAVLLIAPFLVAGVALLGARADLQAAAGSLIEARGAVTSLDPEAARVSLDSALASFAFADRRLSGWQTAALRVVPGLNNNVEVPARFARAGVNLVAVGYDGLAVAEELPLGRGTDDAGALFRDGALNLDPFLGAAAPALRLRANLQEAENSLAQTPTTFLLPPVAEARESALKLLAEARGQADAAVAAAVLLPRLLGQDSPRTWIIGAENNAELRGRGGYLGSFGVLAADGGAMELGTFQPTSGLPRLPADHLIVGESEPAYLEQYLRLGGTSAWQNLFMSPDFPTGARLMLANLRAHAGISAGGVISVDPMALSYLMEVTGPISLEGIPEPITSENVVDWSLNRLYFEFEDENDARRQQIGNIAAVVWSRLISDPALDSRRAITALGRAVAGRHLVVYSGDPEEQALLEEVGLAGTVSDTGGDYLLVLAQNVGENKMDYYMRREISYSGQIQPGGDLMVQAQVKLTNTAPLELDFPVYIGGDRPEITLAGGRSRSFLSVFVPGRALLQEMRVDGAVSNQFENSPELGKRRLGTEVELGPQESRTVTFTYLVPDAVRGGTYRLTVQNQATVVPDTLEVKLELPEDTFLVGESEFTGGRALGWSGPLEGDRELAAGLASDPGLLDRLRSFLRQPVGAAR